MADCFRRLPMSSVIPMVVRPSFTMGGAGSGIAYDEADATPDRWGWAGQAAQRLRFFWRSPSWVEGIRTRSHARQQRQRRGRVFDRELRSVGVHTGDSITVAPALTLTDLEFQRMRDLGIDIIRESAWILAAAISNLPSTQTDGRLIVIEMNPRVSRSSALGVQGNRLSDCQDRGKTGHRLHA